MRVSIPPSAPDNRTDARLSLVPLAPTNPFDCLTAREYEVLQLLSTGATNAQMARTLTLSEGTIRNVVAHVTYKLGVADRTQAALLGCRAGLSWPPD
jgi:DNA-binding NarL/FixJ family response regulator